MHIYQTLIILWLGHFLVDFMIGMFAVYKTIAHMDLAVAGMIAAVSSLFGEASQLAFGTWSDRGYRKHLIMLGLGLTCGSAFLAYAGTSFWIFPLVLATFIGSGAFHPAAASLASSLSISRKGLFYTIFASGGAFGIAASQIVFYEAYTRMAAYIAILAVPSLLLILALIPYRLEQPASKQRTPVKMSAIWGLFRNRELRILYITLVAGTTLFWGFMFLLPDILYTRGCEPWLAFGGGHMAYILGAASMMVLGGHLADRFGPRAVILATLSSGTLMLFTFLLFPLTSNLAILVSLFGQGATLGSVHPIGASLGYRILPNNPGLVSTFTMGMVWCVSESIGPSFTFLTKVFTGPDGPAQACMVLGLLGFIGLYTAYKLSSRAVEEHSFELAS